MDWEERSASSRCFDLGDGNGGLRNLSNFSQTKLQFHALSNTAKCSYLGICGVSAPMKFGPFSRWACHAMVIWGYVVRKFQTPAEFNKCTQYWQQLCLCADYSEDASSNANGRHPVNSSLVVCFGELLIDFVPPVRGVSPAKAPAFEEAPAGAPANAAVGISRLGGSAAFIGKVQSVLFPSTVKRTKH